MKFTNLNYAVCSSKVIVQKWNDVQKVIKQADFLGPWVKSWFGSCWKCFWWSLNLSLFFFFFLTVYKVQHKVIAHFLQKAKSWVNRAVANQLWDTIVQLHREMCTLLARQASLSYVLNQIQENKKGKMSLIIRDEHINIQVKKKY